MGIKFTESKSMSLATFSVCFDFYSNITNTNQEVQVTLTMSKFRLLVPALIMVMLTSLIPAFAATDHKGGQIRVRWTPSNMYLNSNSYIEQEFIPTVNEGLVDGQAFRWTNQYHMDFCWQSTSNSLTNVGNRCGYIGFGLGNKSGNNYFGNFDFAIFNAVEVQKNTNDPQTYCNNSAEAGYVNNTKTYYMNCWRSVVIQMGTPYVLRVHADASSPGADANWWSATLHNKQTNESVTIGKIKAFANNLNQQLALLETVIFYGGDATSCDKVPVMDLRVAPIKSATESSKYQNYWNDNCVNAIALESKQFPGYTSIRLGGIKPESREPGYASSVSTSTPSPSASAKPSTSSDSKPAAPIFSGVKISGNTLNIDVNLGDSQPDNVYLIAPSLFGGSAQKILGEIQGDTASWAIKFDSSLLKGAIPISFFSSKKGLLSPETKIEYLIPDAKKQGESISKKPATPKNLVTRIVGDSLVVTTKVETSGSAAVTNVYLYSSALGISSSKPIKGELLNNSAAFFIPLSANDLTKKIDLNVYTSNKIGKSSVATGSFGLAVPKSPAFNQSNPNTATVICSKGTTIRTFASKICPPGWKAKQAAKQRVLTLKL